MKSRIIAAGILFVVFVFKIHAQQDAQFTQYMYNTLSVNPAYAGTRGVFGAMVLHRSQWVGLDGAPKTQTVNIQGPATDALGLGFSIVNDNIGDGTVQETSFDLAGSYTIRVSDKGKLSFGLKAGGHLLNVNATQLAGYDKEPNPDGRVNIDNKLSPNFGVGFYYHSEKTYFGFSLPNILETEHFDNNESSASKLAIERMNFYLIAGHVFELTPDIKLKPAALLKAVKGAPLQVDFSANFLFNEKFILGAAYRWDAAVSALLGFQLNHQFLVGLAYDREITELGNARFNDGSFEVFLRYEMFTRHKSFKSPRFF
ncbi:MAG: type IX secretion system membrane protein PorP/SprF [Flavobacteriaceae bacterium]|nr:type IX secretion system membrane protein PorP/SprF [Flavobacteriaceae bacterium]